MTMTSSPIRLSVCCLASLLLGFAATSGQPTTERPPSTGEPELAADQRGEERGVKVQYLEIVTPSVNKTCDALSAAHGVVFGEPIAAYGNARTADLTDGGMIGVRAPMRETERPVVRPYLLVNDIAAAVEAAERAGAEVAMPPMEMPGGHGMFSIYILGGIEHGLWQL